MTTGEINFPKLKGTPQDYLAKQVLVATLKQSGLNVEKIEKDGDYFMAYIIPDKVEQAFVERIIYKMPDPIKRWERRSNGGNDETILVPE